jgi:hypothetical protein
MSDKIVVKLVATATNPQEVGRRKVMITQTARTGGAVHIGATEVGMETLMLDVSFDNFEKAKAFQEHCVRQQWLRVLQGVPAVAGRIS